MDENVLENNSDFNIQPVYDLQYTSIRKGINIKLFILLYNIFDRNRLYFTGNIFRVCDFKYRW